MLFTSLLNTLARLSVHESSTPFQYTLFPAVLPKGDCHGRGVTFAIRRPTAETLKILMAAAPKKRCQT
jgi:hypothetical protein